MFAEFDYEKLPIVRVTFNGRIQNASEFDDFINNWRELYNKQENFIFIFDTRNMGMMGTKYCFKMTAFIKELKKRPVQYLQRSIIIVGNRWIRFLLWLIFMALQVHLKKILKKNL